MKRFDVAVVGAGPAGCSAAIFPARKGYSVSLYSSGWILTFGDSSSEEKLHATLLFGADGGNSFSASKIYPCHCRKTG